LNETIQAIVQHKLLQPGAWFVMEHSNRSQIREPVEQLVFRLKKSHGETEVSFYQNG
jgi:16S rRNA G966 N2-methylase RsmD